jgi:hypothetical protein
MVISVHSIQWWRCSDERGLVEVTPANLLFKAY